jgi:hypothetical protein
MLQITWVDQYHYDESVAIKPIAQWCPRWVATLQTHCESLAILVVVVPFDDPTSIYLFYFT